MCPLDTAGGSWTSTQKEEEQEGESAAVVISAGRGAGRCQACMAPQDGVEKACAFSAPGEWACKSGHTGTLCSQCASIDNHKFNTIGTRKYFPKEKQGYTSDCTECPNNFFTALFTLWIAGSVATGAALTRVRSSSSAPLLERSLIIIATAVCYTDSNSSSTQVPLA